MDYARYIRASISWPAAQTRLWPSAAVLTILSLAPLTTPDAGAASLRLMLRQLVHCLSQPRDVVPERGQIRNEVSASAFNVLGHRTLRNERTGASVVDRVPVAIGHCEREMREE